jgi:D-arabinose 1-dehydrogenase-like Zn-dependent alcohol dehydrogenase
MATMKAVRIHTFGGPEVLSLDEVPLPEPHDDEVTLKVCAASVNGVATSPARDWQGDVRNRRRGSQWAADGIQPLRAEE